MLSKEYWRELAEEKGSQSLYFGFMGYVKSAVRYPDDDVVAEIKETLSIIEKLLDDESIDYIKKAPAKEQEPKENLLTNDYTPNLEVAQC